MSYAVIFLVLPLIIGLPAAGISFVINIMPKRKTSKYVLLALDILVFALIIGAFINCSIGLLYSPDWNHIHPCTWIGMGLSIGAISIGSIDLIVTLIIVRIAKNKIAQAKEELNW